MFVHSRDDSGFDVYAPLVDKGVDFILRKENNNIVEYYEVQVKAVRTKESKGVISGRLTIPRGNFKEHMTNRYLAFYHVSLNQEIESYLIPSPDVCRLLKPETQRKKEIWRLNLSKSNLDKINQFKNTHIGQN